MCDTINSASESEAGRLLSERTEHPPRARLVLRVGVTGHLPKDLINADVELLGTTIRQLLQFAKDFVAKLDHTQSYYDKDAKPLLRVVSPLAEGADRLVAATAVALGFELQCPLPFAQDEYERDFGSPESCKEYRELLAQATAVLELDGVHDIVASEGEPYEAVGRLVLSQSDLLIAIWNGEQRNLRGGTSQIVAEAIRRDIPVVWINANQPHQLSVWSAPIDSPNPQSSVQLSDNGPWQSWDSGAQLLSQRLARLLVPPHSVANDSSSSVDSGEPDLREQYFSETQPKRTWGVLWKLFRDCCADLDFGWPSTRVPDFSRSVGEEWEGIWKIPPHVPDEAIKLIKSSRLLEHYGWADGLADYYANVYRSAFVFNYLIGSLSCSVRISRLWTGTVYW